MKRNISIQLKAVLLLVVFGLNTVIGLACALGVDMGFNSSYHDEEAAKVDVLADGKMHNHEKESHSYSQKHKDKKDNCCNDSLAKLSLADKSVPQSTTIINPVFLTTFITAYCNIDILYPSQVSGSTKYFVRSYHPPITDIRLAIQSFQI